MSSRLISTVKVMYETDLAFCAERMKHTQATSHDSKGLPSDKREIPSYDAIFSWSEKAALFGVSPLMSQLSLSGFASNLDMFYR